MAWIGANTSRMRLGTCVTPIQARAPTNMAQTVLTLDHLTQGRVMLGLGVTGVNVAEGWFGQHFDRPVARLREYVSVVRPVLEGRRPENEQGEFYPLPVPGGIGSGKALKSPVRPYREDLPILIGAMGPVSIRLAAEIADGWLPAFFIPEQAGDYRALLEEGFARPGARRNLSNFLLPCPVQVVIDEDVERAAAKVRASIVYLITVMGSDRHNFQLDLFARAGFEAEAMQARALWLEGDAHGAAAAIPLAMVDAIAAIGPKERVREQLLRRVEVPYVSELTVRGTFDDLRTVCEMLA